MTIRRVRAALLALAIVSNAIYALPYGKVTEEQRVDPKFHRAALDLWWSWFSPALPMTQDTFDRTVRGAMFFEHDLVGWLRAPFRPVFDKLHVNQQWGLFAVVTQTPDALVVEVRRGGDNWDTLYRRLDGDHDWRDPQLKYRRIRGVWDGVKEEPKGTYKRLSRWIAKSAFRDDPEVDRVRVLLERTVVTFPWEPVDTSRARRAEQYFRRNELMKGEP
ncbi:MAG: hypothetical protein ABMA64_08750 [Myxococcota bacterium]